MVDRALTIAAGLKVFQWLHSFHPETVLFPFGGVNQHNYSSTY